MHNFRLVVLSHVSASYASRVDLNAGSSARTEWLIPFLEICFLEDFGIHAANKQDGGRTFPNDIRDARGVMLQAAAEVNSWSYGRPLRGH